MPNLAKIIIRENLKRQTFDQKAKNVNCSALEVHMIVLASLIGHDGDELSPMLSWNLKRTDSCDAGAKIFHVITRDFTAAELVQESIACLGSGLWLDLEPSTLIVSRCGVAMEYAGEHSILEVESCTTATDDMTLIRLSWLLLGNNHQKALQQIDWLLGLQVTKRRLSLRAFLALRMRLHDRSLKKGNFFCQLRIRHGELFAENIII